MGPIAKTIAIAAGLAGGTVFSQAPEFAQQYRQRMGGAIDELRVIVDDFTTQAAAHKLDRQEALNVYTRSPDDFLRDRGVSMRSTIDRYEALVLQQVHLGVATSVAKPLVLMEGADERLLSNTWKDFVPGIPVSIAGAIWAAIGFFCGWAIAASLGLVSRRVVRRRHVVNA